MLGRGLATALVVALGLCVVGGARAQTQAEPSPVYDELIDGAVVAFRQGDWASARLLFERAAVVRPSARPLRGMGMADFNLRAFARATVELEAALAAQQQPLDEPLRLQVSELLARASASVARLEVRLQPRSATLQVDGQAPLHDARGRVLVDLGRHSLHLEAERYVPRTDVRTFVQPGEQVLTLAPLAPLPTPEAVEVRRSRAAVRWRRTLVAVGAASLAASLGTTLRADSRFADAQARCRERAGCLAGDVDLAPVRRLDRASIVTLGVGAALTLTAFVLWLVGPAP